MKKHKELEIRPEFGENDDTLLNDFSFDFDVEEEDLNAGDDVDFTTLLD